MDYPTAYHRLIYEQTIHLAKAMDEMAGYPKPQVLAVEGSFTRNPVFMGALKHTIKNLKINILNNVNGPALGAMKAIKESR
jgi:glycerol kinase